MFTVQLPLIIRSYSLILISEVSVLLVLTIPLKIFSNITLVDGLYAELSINWRNQVVNI